MKSIKTTELRTTIPANAIIPIIAVAVMKTGFGWPPTGWFMIAFSPQNPGMMPIIDSGIADMINNGKVREPV